MRFPIVQLLLGLQLLFFALKLVYGLLGLVILDLARAAPRHAIQGVLLPALFFSLANDSHELGVPPAAPL